VLNFAWLDDDIAIPTGSPSVQAYARGSAEFDFFTLPLRRSEPFCFFWFGPRGGKRAPQLIAGGGYDSAFAGFVQFMVWQAS